MDMRIAGALVGFILGFVGYIIFKFSVSPIRRYRRLKDAIQSDIRSYTVSISEKTWNKESKKRLKNTRKKVSELNDCYNHDIPVWYRIILRRRNESPQEAAKHLMDLANIREDLHALKRLEKAEAALLINQAKGIQNL
ncbi:MAG: hypothetical protein R6U27_08595 [Desulfobacterales bacterium]